MISPVGLHLTSHVISGSRGVHVSSDLHLHAYLHAPLSVLVYYILLVCWCIYMYYLLVGLLLVMEFPMMLVMELLMLLVIEILMLCISLAVGLHVTSCWSVATRGVLLLRIILLVGLELRVVLCATRCSDVSTYLLRELGDLS